jgi:hypothetical protein
MNVRELLILEDELRNRWRFAQSENLDNRMKVFEDWENFLKREVELK